MNLNFIPSFWSRINKWKPPANFVCFALFGVFLYVLFYWQFPSFSWFSITRFYYYYYYYWLLIFSHFTTWRKYIWSINASMSCHVMMLMMISVINNDNPTGMMMRKYSFFPHLKKISIIHRMINWLSSNFDE